MKEIQNEYEESTFDYFTPFIKKTITELKSGEFCYVFNKAQVEEIKKEVPNVSVSKNECGYTLILEKVV